jgi:hypothetical protein
VRRGRENAAELSAAGVLRAPLYWIVNALTFAALGLAMYMASRTPPEFDSGVWLAATALFVAALVARLLLKRRYFV